MRAKDYLKQLRGLRWDIETQQKIIENVGLAIKIEPSGIDYSKDVVQTSPKDSMSEAGWRLVSRMAYAKGKLERLVEKRDTILNLIGEMENAEHAKILMMRYDDGMSYFQIADELGCSYSVVTHLHGYAIREFENIFKSQQEKTKTCKNI